LANRETGLPAGLWAGARREKIARRQRNFAPKE
jgi:hypothetical protein